MQPVISADLDTIMPRTTNQPLIVFKDTGAKPVGQQAVSNQPLIVSNGTGANQPPPN
jgi:hypothetical protein